MDELGTLVVTFLVAVIGGGGVATLAMYRYNRDKTKAETRSSEADAAETLVSTAMSQLERLRSDLDECLARVAELEGGQHGPGQT